MADHGTCKELVMLVFDKEKNTNIRVLHLKKQIELFPMDNNCENL